MLKKLTKQLMALLLAVMLLLSFAAPVFAYQQISSGSKGEDVKTMQKMLNAVMNAGLDVDGNCGPKSVAAIKSFQKAYGLTVDGYCGKNTWAKLEAEYNKKVNPTVAKCTSHKKGTFSHTDTAHPHKKYYKCANCGVTFTDGTTTKVSGCTTCYPATQSYQQISSGSKGEDVKTMQKMLNAVMNAGLDVDGNCGPKSVAAIKSFQKAYGLTVDGYCGKNTWAKLEAEYNKKVNPTVAKCTSHKKGTFSHTDTAHPHKKYYKCANCGVTFTDGTTTKVSGCTTCGNEFEPELIEYNKTMYSVINNVVVRNQPYAKSGTLVRRLAKGEAVKVTHYFYNALGKKWYVTSDGNYIFGDYLTLTGVKKHTLTFNANGSGVTNLPETAHIQEGVRMAIPGKVSGVPIRSGYTFIGYSTDKNATTAEYVPGRAIKLTKDTTLYAIWVKLNVQNGVTSEIKALMDKEQGCAQYYTYIDKVSGKNVGTSDKSKSEGCGLCTSSSATTLIQRMEVRLTGKPSTFTFGEFRQSGGYQWSAGGSYSGGTPKRTYKFSYKKPAELGKTNAEKLSAIKDLLAQHPEGIFVYAYYSYYSGGKLVNSLHAIVISDYENGTFYAYDPVDHNSRMKLEDVYMLRCYKSVTGKCSIDNLLDNLIHVAYITAVN